MRNTHLSAAILVAFCSCVIAHAQVNSPNLTAAAADRKAKQIARMLESLPIVALPMTATAVEALMTRVGLLPATAALEKPFADAVTAAVAVSDASRQTFATGPFADATLQFTAKMAAQGYPSRSQGPLVKDMRARVLAIDLTLIESAAAALGRDERINGMIEQAKLMRRADAAAETMAKAASFALPFTTVTPAFNALVTLSDSDRVAMRALLLSDAADRAQLAERLSFAHFEGTALMAGETAIGLQIAARDRPAVEPKIEGMELMGVAMLIQLGGVYSAASSVATLNAQLEQALQSQLTPTIAFTLISALESGPSSRQSRYAPRTIVELEAAAIALARVTAEQSIAISNIATAWRLEEVQSYLTKAQSDGPRMREIGLYASGIVVNDPTTWPIAGATPGASSKLTVLTQRSQQQLIARQEAQDRASKEIDQVLGAELATELAAQLTPPKQKQ
jgi:hypothetical protein